MFNKYKIYILSIFILVIFFLYRFKFKTFEYYDNLYHGWNNYRLGDCIKSKNEWFKDFHLKKYPNSIASKYLKKTKKKNDYNILYDIVKTYNNNTPQDNVVIHLRIGDVLEKKGWCNNHTCKNYSYEDINIYKKIANDIKNNTNFKNIIIVAGSHYNYNNYDNSYKYINQVENIFKDKGFNVKKRLGYNPDSDLVYMSNSKYFVSSGTRGGFTKIISEMVNRNNGTVYKL
tara:strand:- start:181 stop:870 length:690 start_codon:yes stop_codon:yes gene_type:complete